MLVEPALEVPAAAAELELAEPDVAPAELDVPEELPQAAMNAANPVAAAPAPIRLPAIFKNRLRLTSSPASCSTTPTVCRSHSLVVVSVIRSPCVWGRECLSQLLRSAPGAGSSPPQERCNGCAGATVDATRCA